MPYRHRRRGWCPVTSPEAELPAALEAHRSATRDLLELLARARSAPPLVQPTVVIGATSTDADLLAARLTALQAVTLLEEVMHLPAGVMVRQLMEAETLAALEGDLDGA